MASWLVCSTPDQEVCVQALAVVLCCVVFLGKTLNSHSASFPPGVEIGFGEVNAGGNLVID